MGWRTLDGIAYDAAFDRSALRRCGVPSLRENAESGCHGMGRMVFNSVGRTLDRPAAGRPQQQSRNKSATVSDAGCARFRDVYEPHEQLRLFNFSPDYFYRLQSGME